MPSSFAASVVRRLLAGAVALLAAAEMSAQRPTSMAGRSTVYAPHAMVATSQPLASAAGLSVLREGGNAIDAAVAAAAVLSVTEPHMTGIGGDMFALVWLAGERRLVALNASGRAGTHMTREALERRGFRAGSQQGALSVTVPGGLAGWDLLVRTHGRRTLAQALQPAIGYARDGFPVTPIIAAQWANETEFLRRDPSAAATFLPDGRAPKAGEWFQNPDYARTLEAIADSGIQVVYGGSIGQRIVAHLSALGGFLTLDDLRATAPTWVTPMSVAFQGYRVWELPPNNQGIAALEMLRILEPFDLRAMGHNSAPYLHHLIEAKKLAYADLDRFVGDADHLDMPAEAMLSDAFIAERRSHLDPLRAQVRVDPGPVRTKSETVYLTVADVEGNMVSFINSIYDYFGSGVVVPGTGISLQNRGFGFVLDEGHPNQVGPRKRQARRTRIATSVGERKTRRRRACRARAVSPWCAWGPRRRSSNPNSREASRRARGHRARTLMPTWACWPCHSCWPIPSRIGAASGEAEARAGEQPGHDVRGRAAQIVVRARIQRRCS